MPIKSITFEKNEFGEDVRVITMEDGAEVRELARQPDAPPEERHRKLSIAAWRFRFTREERVAIEFASLDDPAASMEQRKAAAALRSDIRDQESAQFIDLDDPAVLAGLQNLVAYGLLAANRPAEIQEPDAEPGERP